ncbi:MAG TPA: CBS domain-containing protein, partial [Methanoregulaceae archaeon]|nr:CBS domain-containing protein [Methanoregulaceae archaeon]
PKKSIRHYMTSPLKTLRSLDTLRDALILFNHSHIHGAPVIEDDRLLGIITMSDIAHAVENNLSLNTLVSEVMTTDVVEAPADVRLFEVIGRFKEREIGRLIVVEKGKPVGILTQSDILRVFPSL